MPGWPSVPFSWRNVQQPLARDNRAIGVTGGPLDLRLCPTSEEDYAAVGEYIKLHREAWQAQLIEGADELIAHLRAAAGHSILPRDARSTAVPGRVGVTAGEIVLMSRVKEGAAIIAKMRRFGEPLSSMLDIWGYRLIVGPGGSIDQVAQAVAVFWTTPSDDELLLRNGELHFPWWRDYRLQSHAGLSPIAPSSYDDAIHINRRAGFGIAEFQVMIDDLYRRAYSDPSREESHDRYVAKRAKLFEQS